MSKIIIVETTGQFMLIDRSNGYQEIDPNGPTEVTVTPFIERKLREGALRKLEDVSETDDTPRPASKGRRGR